MPHRRSLLLFLVIAVALAVGGFAASQFNLSALPEPGGAETYLATRAKYWIVARSAREVLAAPPNDANSVTIGGMQFRSECASCHGTEGTTPTDVGQWMYPRTLDLSSPEVQHWTDAELFWIIKNGIRLSGMPGFGKIHTDDQIWHLVHYVRSLRKQPRR